MEEIENCNFVELLELTNSIFQKMSRLLEAGVIQDIIPFPKKLHEKLVEEDAILDEMVTFNIDKEGAKMNET